MSGHALMKMSFASWWGKLPSQGDFVGRRLPHALTRRWDEWLRNGMDQLHMEAGGDWAQRFIQSPPWFFMCPQSVMGLAMVGVIGPSMDRIGRLFPLAIMATCDVPDSIPVDGGPLERFLAGARDVLFDARSHPLLPQQVDERLETLPWPFWQVNRDALIDALLGEPGAVVPVVEPQSVQLPRVDWRACMRLESSASVWWVSPTPIYRQDEVVQSDMLQRQHFMRLFKGTPR